MIGEVLVDLFFGLFRGLFSAVEVIGLPYQTLSALRTILVYGNWIVGVDILILFASIVVFWWVFKMSIGLIVWVWEHLPLT